jgi:acetylornithine deacetylase
MSVTQIEAGHQHNIIPAECRFVVDVRVTDRYTNEQVLEVIKQSVKCEVKERSTRLKSSYIDPTHPIVQAGLELGRTTFGSPTSSDQMLLTVPSLKMGIGDSARSHSADEYIELKEIAEGIDIYIELLTKVIE